MVFGPWGGVSRVCLEGVYWDVWETFVVRGRGAGRFLVVFSFLCTSQDEHSVVTNSLVCFVVRVESLVTSYIEFVVCT